ncbi:unnamed protein product, partial [marine sediment metagenome]
RNTKLNPEADINIATTYSILSAHSLLGSFDHSNFFSEANISKANIANITHLTIRS